MATSHVDDLYRVDRDDAVVLHVHVQPAAGRSAVVGRHGTALKVRVAAAPEGGRANDACADLLAETFGLKRAQIELVSGPSSRAKQFKLAASTSTPSARSSSGSPPAASAPAPAPLPARRPARPAPRARAAP